MKAGFVVGEKTLEVIHETRFTIPWTEIGAVLQTKDKTIVQISPKGSCKVFEVLFDNEEDANEFYQIVKDKMY